MSEFDLIRAKLAELERKQQSPGPRKCSSLPRDEFRGMMHAAFVAVVDYLENQGWSRNKIAAAFDVHPVTLKDWIESGDAQRNQLPGWSVAAIARLPGGAWGVFIGRLFASGLDLSERTGTDE